MRARFWIILLVACTSIVCLWPITERRFELDEVNLQLRYRSVTRSRLVPVVYHDRSSEPTEHATARRLRAMSVLPPVIQEQSRWVLIKGFRLGIRGWIGPGRLYIRVLGESSFGTPVTLPVPEDLSQNVWVRWAENQPEVAVQFWRRFQCIAQETPLGGELLIAVRAHIEDRRLSVEVSDFESRIERFVLRKSSEPH
jgi:hypothetical protein